MSIKNRIWIELQSKLGNFERLKGLNLYDEIFQRINKVAGIPVPLKIRELYDALQKQDLSRDGIYPEISLGIVCHPKDFANLDLVIQMAKKNCKNPITDVSLVTTLSGYKTLKTLFPEYNVYNETDFVSQRTFDAIAKEVPSEISGWVLQQAAKFTIVLNSKNDATLILDADTVLLKRRLFLTENNVQSLSYSHEYHLPYVKHYAKFSGQEIDSNGHSFVTHHQLMQKEVVKSLLGTEGEALPNWILAADYGVFSPLCEYHCYGEELIRKYPSRFKVTRWGNLPVSASKLRQTQEHSQFTSLENAFNGWNSISVHSYL